MKSPSYTATWRTSRLQVNKPPFTRTGIDFFGPLILGYGRKAWGFIAMCMTTRAIHLEAVSSLNVETFLMALSRFVDERGAPEIIRCDNGTNFVGANNELRRLVELNRGEVQTRCTFRWRTKFIFNPPGSPHYGGSYERTIPEVKKALHGSEVSFNGLSLEAFWAALKRAQKIVNSRPIACGLEGEIITPLQIINPYAHVEVTVPGAG